MRKNEGGKKKREKSIGCREGLRESELQLPAPPAPAHAQRGKEGAAAPCVRTRADWRDALSVRATPRPAAAVPARGSARGARRSERGGGARTGTGTGPAPRPGAAPPAAGASAPGSPAPPAASRYRTEPRRPHHDEVSVPAAGRRAAPRAAPPRPLRLQQGAGRAGGGTPGRRRRREEAVPEPPPSCAGCGTPGGAAPCGTAGGAAPGRWGAGVCVWGSYIAAPPPPPLIPRPPRAAAPRYRSTQRGYTEGLGTPAPTTSPSVTLRDQGVLCGRLIALQRSDTPGAGGRFAPP